jgi:hypothetical protein
MRAHDAVERPAIIVAAIPASVILSSCETISEKKTFNFFFVPCLFVCLFVCFSKETAPKLAFVPRPTFRFSFFLCCIVYFWLKDVRLPHVGSQFSLQPPRLENNLQYFFLFNESPRGYISSQFPNQEPESTAGFFFFF